MNAEQLDRDLEGMIGDGGTKVPGLGVIIRADGREIYSKFVGRSVVDGARSKPVTRLTRFRAASVSKMFTVFSLMQLAEQGRIDLDADVSEYLKFPLRNPAQPDEKITARRLACHTSSLRDGRVYSIAPGLSVRNFFSPDGRYWEDGAHFAPRDEPVGEYFTYCNLNYGLLATIIEAVTGRRFDLYQRENILSQLSTRADYLPGNLADDEFDRLGAIYRKQKPSGEWNECGAWYAVVDDFHGRRPKRDVVSLQNPYDESVRTEYSLADYLVGTNATAFSPQGGLRISFEELSHALEMLMNDGEFRGRRILSRDSIRTMSSPHWTFDPTRENGDTCDGAILSYGLGLYSIDGSSSSRVCRDHVVDLIGHTGEAYGLFAGLFFVPSRRLGFVYMINGEAIAEDIDPRSRGEFSGNYIWEEKIMDAVCRFTCALYNRGKNFGE